MDYTNRICSVCGNAFNADDDIVVCPECATPHHRECWFQNGKCVNSEKHAEGFIWTAANENSVKKEATAETDHTETEYNENSVKICHVCGSENPEEAQHCGNCRALLNVTQENQDVVNCSYCGAENNSKSMRCARCGAPIIRVYHTDNPFIYNAGMHPDEPVAGVTANEVSFYTQGASKYYLRKFKKIDNNGITFNWAAFFFAPYWFFYRKLYKAGIAALLVFVSISMLTVGLISPAFEAYEKYVVTLDKISEDVIKRESKLTADEEKIIVEAQENFVNKSALPLMLSLVLLLLPKIICALIADKLYYNKMKADLKLISEAVDDKDVKQIMIIKRGRASAVAFATALLGEQFLITIFTAIADYISR